MRYRKYNVVVAGRKKLDGKVLHPLLLFQAATVGGSACYHSYDIADAGGYSRGRYTGNDACPALLYGTHRVA